MEQKKRELKEIFQAELNLRPKNLKNIQDLETTRYPTTFSLPDLELNFPVEPGRFRYHRSFLLRFKDVCTERPASLIPLDWIGLDPNTFVEKPPSSRGRRGGGGREVGGRAPQSPASFAIGLGSGFSRPGFPTGHFPTPPLRPGDSLSRFEVANMARFGAMPSAGGLTDRSMFETWTPIQRSDIGGGILQIKRTRVQRGRDDGGNMHASGFSIPVNQTTSLGPVAPLKPSENRWVPIIGIRANTQREIMEFNVQGLLNKLTVVNFDSILAQIISWANRPEQDKDGATLRQVVKLILGQAKEDAVFSGTYARLCSRIADRVSPRIQDEFSRNSQRQSITGGMLFRTYLIDQCQEDFEGRWDTHRATLALSRSIKGKTTAITPNFSGEKGLRSDEHDMTRKANRQCVGLVQFMGELFKLQLLTEYAIHECIKKLLSDIVNPEEGDIEGLCKLLATIGQTLDTPNARNRMDGHFERIQKMAKSGHLGFRMQFMLLDMIELRARYWQLHHANPLSILAHPNSSREGSGRRNVARGGSRRGEHRGNSVTESDGWNVTGGAGTSRPVVRAGDLSQFGRISKPTGIQFGPSSVFNRKTTKPNLSPRTKPNETGVRQLP